MSTKRNWLISCPDYDKNLGSSVVLHDFAKELTEIGDVVVTTTKSPFDGIRQSSDALIQTMDKKDWIVVVSEDVCHENSSSFFDSENKSKFPNVVRWILYTLGGFEGYKGYYHPNELVVQYGKSFTIDTPYQNCPEMTNLVFETDFWQDLKLDRSDTDLILFKKGRHYFNREKLELSGRILDDEDFNDDVLLQAFNEHKRFITYDNETFHSVQAAVCGAISIVIPNGRLSEDEWRSVNTIRKWGIAYGDTPEQIKFAIETRNLLLDEIDKLKSQGENQILEMRNKAIKKFPNQYFITCIIETEWKNMNLVRQLKRFKQEHKISQIIILDRNKKNRPDFIDFSEIEIIETNLDKIPAIELGIENSDNDLVMVVSGKLEFEVGELSNILIENKHGIGFITIGKENYLHKNTNFGFKKLENIDFASSKIFDNIFVIRKSEYIKSPNLKNYGLTMWCDKIFKNKHILYIQSKIDGLDIEELDLLNQQIDREILEKLK